MKTAKEVPKAQFSLAPKGPKSTVGMIGDCCYHWSVLPGTHRACDAIRLGGPGGAQKKIDGGGFRLLLSLLVVVVAGLAPMLVVVTGLPTRYCCGCSYCFRCY